jgi:predicted MPP superfamily phosphohydrolase
MILTRKNTAPPGSVQPHKTAPQALSRRGFFKTGLGLIGGAGLAIGATTTYAAAEAAFELKVTAYRPRLPAWPSGRKLSIAVIADLHAGGPNMALDRVRQVVDTCNGLDCDLIVLLGDYFATHRFVTRRVPHEAWAGELARLRAPLGVFAIFGNHDWWFDIDGVRRALAQVKIPVLENQAVLLGEQSRRFWLAGLGDQIAHRLGRDKFRGVDDLPGTLSKVRTADPVILLAHEPDIFIKVPERVTLTLAGHTHGGQIRLPLIWPAFVPSAYGARFAYGHIVEKDRHMIVSGGIGTSEVPLRLGVPPEILRVDLGA